MIFLSDSIQQRCQSDFKCQISQLRLLRLETVSELAMVDSIDPPERVTMYPFGLVRRSQCGGFIPLPISWT